jgi:hypothetical protein
MSYFLLFSYVVDKVSVAVGVIHLYQHAFITH